MKLTGDNGVEVISLSFSYDDIPDDANRASTTPPSKSRFDDLRKAKAERSAARSNAAREAARVLRDDKHHDGGGNERVRLDRAKQQYLGNRGGDDSVDLNRKANEIDEGRLS